MIVCPYCDKEIPYGDMCCDKCFKKYKGDVRTGLMYQLYNQKNNKASVWQTVNVEMKNKIKKKKLFEVLQ